MAFCVIVLFLLIFTWDICKANTNYRQVHSSTPEDVYLHGSVLSNTDENFPTSKYVVFPSSPGSTKQIEFVHSLTAAVPLSNGNLRKVFGQQLKWTAYKKPTKYSKRSSSIKLIPALQTNIYEKNCCEDRWPWLTSKNNAYAYQIMRQPSRPAYYPSNQDYGYRTVDDVKPVVEHIEGDLKYDFRTGIHSF